MKWISAWIFIFPVWAANGAAFLRTSERCGLQDTAKQPTVQLEEGLLRPMLFITIRDTAANQADMGRIFSKDYGELYRYIYQNGLKPGKLLARYYSVQPFFVFDVGVEVDKLPLAQEGEIKVNRLEGGWAIIAHFKGPYEQIGFAYSAIQSWLAANNRSGNGQPFEVYLNQPGNVQDAFELRTDIYQPITADVHRGEPSVKEILITCGW